ncbi:MAG: ABC transporter permease [candidate division Zixibacteria bacterium]|nr:ABC transporter permease [candidate division Zixibacteria bacterium]
MIRNYLTVVFRTLTRQKAFSLVSIASLTVGMTCSALLAMFVCHELSFDRIHESLDRIGLLVMTKELSTGRQVIPSQQAPLAPLIKEHIPEVQDYVRMVERGHTLASGEKTGGESIWFADPSFFSVLSFRLTEGDSATALSEPHSVVMTAAAASRYFGEKDPIGRSITLNGSVDLKVTGLLEEIPDNSSLRFDILVPFALLSDAGEDPNAWMGADYLTLLLAPKGTDLAEMGDKVSAFCRKYYTDRDAAEGATLSFRVEPMGDLRLHGIDETGGTLSTVVALSGIAISLLLVSCLNFVMLTTARLSQRTREIGVRKVLGAEKWQVARHLMLETVFVSLLAVPPAIVMTEVLLPQFDALTGKQLSMSDAVLPLVGVMALFVLVCGISAGIAPVLSSMMSTPVQALRGKIVEGRKGGRLRQTLVAAQFAVVIIAISITLFVNQQLGFVLSKDLGLDKSNVIWLSATSQIVDSYESFSERVRALPGVVAVTLSLQGITNISSTIGNNWNFEGRDEDLRLELHWERVNYEYDKVLGLRMAAGRFYSKEFPSDATEGIVLNKRAVQLMGMTDPIGKRFSYWDRPKTIIGVVDDFNLEPLTEPLKPMLLIFGRKLSNIFVKLNPENQKQTLAGIAAIYTEMSPGTPFDYTYLDALYRDQYQSVDRMKEITSWSSAIVIVITSAGLLAMMSLTVARRRREIGIRKAIGATESGITLMFLKELLILVGLSFIVSLPVSYLTASSWLGKWAYHVDLNWSVFVVSGLLAIVIAVATVGVLVIRAARTKPSETLRYE